MCVGYSCIIRNKIRNKMNVISRQCLRIFKCDLTQQSQLYLGRTRTYKSAFSLDKLYPTSNLKIYTPTFVPADSKAQFTGYIPLDELDITYSRSSDERGQNVNSVNTAVDIKLNVRNASWLSDEVKSKLIEQHTSKLSKDGCLTIKSDLTRSQQLNLADVLRKLRAMVWEVIKPIQKIPLETEELKRKQILKAARERLFVKQQYSKIEQDKEAQL